MAKQLYHPKAKEIDAFTFKVNVTSATVYPVSGILRIQLPLVNGKTYACWVDWGDGTAKQYINAYNSANSAHTYSSEGIYTIRIAGVCQGFYVNGSTATYSIKNTITEVVKWGTKADFRQLDFYNCINLTKLPYDVDGMTAITGAASITTFANFVRGCTSLAQDLNDRLFSLCPNVTTFYYTFGSSAVQGTIPEDMFVEQSTNVTTFEGTFYDCNVSGTIPRYLFYYNTNVTTFQRTFYSSLVSGRVNAYLFEKNTKVQYFTETFGYTNVHGTVSSLLFTYANTSVLSFNGTFRNTNMGWDDSSNPTETLPDDIFDTNTNATDFSWFVAYTKYTHSFPLLWQVSVKGKYFSGTFAYTPFSGIPDDSIFVLCTEMLACNSVFQGTNITELPNNLLWTCTKLQNASSYCSNCYSLGNNPTLGYGIYNKEIFLYCPDLTQAQALFWDDYNIGPCPIPEDMFWANTKLQTAGQIFGKNYWAGTIPEKLFAECPDITAINYLFYWGGSGSNPYATGQIPRDFLAIQTKLNTAYMAFRWCNFTRAEAGLFRNCWSLYDMQYCFQSSSYCKIDKYLFSESNDASAFDRFKGSLPHTFVASFQGAGNNGREYFLEIDVAPTTDWAVGDVITGQTSGSTSVILEKITSLKYRVKNVMKTVGTYYYPPTSNPYTLGEVIGVTGDSNKLADQGTSYPVISYTTANTSYATEFWEPKTICAYRIEMTAQPRPTTLWKTGDTLLGQTSGAECVMVTDQVLTGWSFRIKSPTKEFTKGEVIQKSGGGSDTYADQNSNMPQWGYQDVLDSGQYIVLTVAPTVDWVCGDVITGQSSGTTAIVIRKKDTLKYYIRDLSGDFTDGEVIGVTGNSDKLADQSGAVTYVCGDGGFIKTSMYNGLSSGVWENLADIPVEYK